MYKVIKYEEFVNEEFDLGSVKKFMIGAGIIVTVCFSSCVKNDNIAFNVSKSTEISKKEKHITKGTIINERRWEDTYYNSSTKTTTTDYYQNIMVDVGKDVFFIVIDGYSELKKGDLIYIDLKGNGKGYVIKGEKVYRLQTFGSDRLKDIGYEKPEIGKETKTKNQW